VLIFVQKYVIKIFAQEFARRIHNGQAETRSGRNLISGIFRKAPADRRKTG